MITKLKDDNFNEHILKGLKLVEFYTSWCGYCQKQESILKELDKIWIGKVDGDESQYLVQRFQIKGYPTFLVFKDGKEVTRFLGLHSKFDIMNILLKYL